MTRRTLTIRGIPDDTLARLRERAEGNRRSLNGELLTILERAAEGALSAWEGAAGSGPAASGPANPTSPGVRETAATPYSAAPAPADDVPARGDDVLARVDGAELARVCRRHDIVWLAIFGSYARGAAHAASDVDVAVDFAPGRTPGFGIVRVAAALRPLFGGRRVDLVTRRGLSPRLRERVLSTAVTLYVAE